MTTVKELKEYLETLPEDAEVLVLEEEHMGGYSGYAAVWNPLNLHPYEGNASFYDYSTPASLYLGEK
jgi:hypothetical protein